MPNPLFNQLMNKVGSQNPFQNMSAFMQQLNEYKSHFQGNPNEILNNLMRSGKIPQDRLNGAIEAAKQIQRFIH